jgi:hypothetical protein
VLDLLSACWTFSDSTKSATVLTIFKHFGFILKLRSRFVDTNDVEFRKGKLSVAVTAISRIPQIIGAVFGERRSGALGLAERRYMEGRGISGNTNSRGY